MKYISAFILSLLISLSAPAHSGFDLHRRDFYAVLGFQESAKVTEWMRVISSDMIDNYKGTVRQEYGGLDFYSYLKSEFPGFKCKHRLLFHWGYNARPWSQALQEKVKGLPWGSDSVQVRRFQQALVSEQQLRNAKANAYTEELFGFASAGKEASYANAMISIVYDTHLIGDYTPDNNDLDGLQDFESVVGDLINAVRKLDQVRGKKLVKKIQKVSEGRTEDLQQCAAQMMELLTSEMPDFLRQAQGGALKKRFAKSSIKFAP